MNNSSILLENISPVHKKENVNKNVLLYNFNETSINDGFYPSQL